MSLCGVAHPLRLEQLARRLTGKRSDQAWSGCSREGNTPREALFPFLFPLGGSQLGPTMDER